MGQAETPSIEHLGWPAAGTLRAVVRPGLKQHHPQIGVARHNTGQCATCRPTADDKQIDTLGWVGCEVHAVTPSQYPNLLVQDTVRRLACSLALCLVNGHLNTSRYDAERQSSTDSKGASRNYRVRSHYVLKREAGGDRLLPYFSSVRSQLLLHYHSRHWPRRGGRRQALP